MSRTSSALQLRSEPDGHLADDDTTTTTTTTTTSDDDDDDHVIDGRTRRRRRRRGASTLLIKLEPKEPKLATAKSLYSPTVPGDGTIEKKIDLHEDRHQSSTDSNLTATSAALFY
ncbi:hypothetical protein RRG08_035746 [Elysia crispata]|uniref:Uncharacterized protein n=1 Tax=Elysia crispata TaxID=231223 RepID=A0AAE1E7Q8_9GAST|nr:hypothetical protein RRG08_035746 [Elysia crispata]